MLCFFAILPLMRIAHGFVRGGDFPRQQFAIIAVIMIPVIWWIDLPAAGWASAALLAVICLQVFYIGRYLPVWHVQSLRPMTNELVSDDRRFTIVAANVKMSNRSYDRLVSVLRKARPDIVLAIEVDRAWCSALEALSDLYPHRYAQPQDNGYGLMVLSRFEIPDAVFSHRVVNEVPSLRGTVQLASGDRFRLYVVHPEPPVPHHDTEGRDAELAKIAFEAAADPLPVVVSGDLNDVAWSKATQRFQQISQLLDPRVGRGFYNTFSATNILMRWPLDQLFHSAHFRFLDMQRLPKIGSDHFPMLFALALIGDEKAAAHPKSASVRDRAEARDMIAREQASDREAIGSDWENDPD